MIISQRMKEGIERIGKASAGKADRVPILAQINEHARKLGGYHPKEYYRNDKIFFENQLLVSDYYSLDFPGTEYYDIYNIEAEALGQELIWFDDLLPEINHKNHLIKGPSDLNRLAPPDPKKSGRMPFVLDLKKRAIDAGFFPGVRYSAPFSLAASLCGLQDLIIGMMTEPVFYHRLFSFLTDEVLAPWIYEQRRAIGADSNAMGADAYASMPITNIGIIREFALNYVLRLRKNVGNVSARGWWGERCARNKPGKLDEFMAMKLEAANPGYYLALDPDIEIVGIETVRAFADEHNVPLMLGIETKLVSEGPVEKIVDRIRRYIEEGGRNGRLLLFLNEIPKEAPPEHVHAAVHAAKLYGSYPFGDDQFTQTFKMPDSISFGKFLQQYEAS
jgi:uroporphyrinogen-III decarboxylase